ncbi:Uncharacterised protein [Raoultella terrigena]|uniref:Uncharacterized protein n=1 Tax=Raoultella terrigena TaxID=577 RepID=A0A4U9D0G5_RAOTE|nr:Uncharacterised protein [Raoultella terrigena]
MRLVHRLSALHSYSPTWHLWMQKEIKLGKSSDFGSLALCPIQSYLAETIISNLVEMLSIYLNTSVAIVNHS